MKKFAFSMHHMQCRHITKYLQLSARKCSLSYFEAPLNAFGTARFYHEVESSVSPLVCLNFQVLVVCFSGFFHISLLQKEYSALIIMSWHRNTSLDTIGGAKFPREGQRWDHVILRKLEWGHHISKDYWNRGADFL